MEPSMHGTRRAWNPTSMEFTTHRNKTHKNWQQMEPGVHGTQRNWNPVSMEPGMLGTQHTWNPAYMEPERREPGTREFITNGTR